MWVLSKAAKFLFSLHLYVCSLFLVVAVAVVADSQVQRYPLPCALLMYVFTPYVYWLHNIPQALILLAVEIFYHAVLIHKGTGDNYSNNNFNIAC